MNKELFDKLKQAYSHLGLADDILQSHADVLAGMGFVTAENIDDVITKQKPFLEGLQRYNDSRVNDAVAKASEKALKDAEQKVKKEAEEAARKAREEAEKNLPESVKAILESIKADRAAEKEAAEAAKKLADEERKTYQESMQKKLDEMALTINGFREENEALKKAQAARQRQEAIIAKAKELGIPQWRIDEGFVIADEADEAAYTATLTSIAKNVKTNALPANVGRQFSESDTSKEEIDSIAESMVKNL